MTNELKKWQIACAQSPGSRWRLHSYAEDGDFEIEDRGKFDELVVDHWLHVERMDERVWVVRVGERGFLVTVKPDGVVEVVESG